MPSSDRTAFSAEEIERMQRLGITHSLVHTFQYGQYRYSNLKDAVAQAERDQDSRK